MKSQLRSAKLRFRSRNPLLRPGWYYWASITILIVMQPTLGAALPISAQRFAGTAVGPAVAPGIDTYFPGNVVVFGIAVFMIEVVCAPPTRLQWPIIPACESVNARNAPTAHKGIKCAAIRFWTTRVQAGMAANKKAPISVALQNERDPLLTSPQPGQSFSDGPSSSNNTFLPW